MTRKTNRAIMSAGSISTQNTPSKLFFSKRGLYIMGGRGAYAIRRAFANQIFSVSPSLAGTGGGGVAELAGRGLSDAEMDREFAEWRNSLTESQIEAIAAYTNGAYGNINRYLRGIDKNPSQATKDRIKQLRAAFTHSLSKNITVYRGVGVSNAKLHNEMTTVGSVFRDKGALSTSTSKALATSWASSKDNAVVYSINLPKDFKNAAWVKAISPYKHEKEVLIKPGQKWRVTQELSPIRRGNKRIRHLVIEPI